MATALLACSADAPVTTLQVPRPPRTGEGVFVEIALGSLARGNRVEVTTAAGRFLGTISPFGTRPNSEGGTYTVPVPLDAVSGDHISIRILINDGKQKRAPEVNEIRSMVVKVVTPPK